MCAPSDILEEMGMLIGVDAREMLRWGPSVVRLVGEGHASTW